MERPADADSRRHGSHQPDPAQSGGLALVEFAGKKPNMLTEPLWNKYRVLVTGIEHKDFAGLRVTPNVYTTLGELDIFCSGVEKILKS